jgi:uncharacterized membrane protein YeaQ/YmgE (transglycosylase-associated protein family)
MYDPRVSSGNPFGGPKPQTALMARISYLCLGANGGGATMDIMAVVVTLIIGAIAGWLAGVIVEGGGFGLLVNILLGIAGAFIATMLFPRLGLGLTLGGGVVGAIVTSALGAVVLLLIVNLVQRLM